MSSVELKNPDALRLQMRTQALDSLYFLSKAVLGYKDLSPRIHMELCAFLEDGSFTLGEDGKPLGIDKLVELSRGHLKTSICTIAYPIWRALHNPDIRILIANATATNASHFLRTIMGHFDSNKIFRWLFPEVLPEKGKTKWTSDELEIKRTKIWPEATFESIGVGGKATSRHYDLIIEDDLVAAEHLESSEQMMKIIDWHRYSISLSVSPKSLHKLVVGTRWAFNDLISHILDVETQYKLFRRGATVDKTLSDDAQPVWPERFSLETLRNIQKTQGNKIFATQYMNHPTFEDPNAFDLSIIRKFDTLPEHGNFVYYTAIDPAISEKGGDFSAIVTVGKDHLNNIFCVEAKKGRWGVDKLIEEIMETFILWQSRRVGLETVMFQKVLMWPLREAMRRYNVVLPIEELRPSSKIVKNGRIATLRDYFATGTLWIRSNMKDVFRELEEFPVGSHDDVIDALAYAVHMTRPIASPTSVEKKNPFMISEIMKELKNKQDTGENAWSSFPVLSTV